MMTDEIGIAIEKWSHEQIRSATDWLYSVYGPVTPRSWFVDIQPRSEYLIMRKDIYFMFVAAFGEDYGSTS